MSLYPPSITIPVYCVLTALGIGLTALRFWVRVSYSRIHPGLDDLFAAAGTVVACTCTAIQIYNAVGGASGEAVSDAEQEEAATIELEVDFSMIAIEKLAFGAIKLSLLFFYRRIFGVWSSFRRVNAILVAVVAVWTVVFFIADFLLCGDHPELQWSLDQEQTRQGCGSRGIMLVAFAATSVLTDLMVLALPLIYIRRLQMPSGKKWATSLVFLLGAISTLAGILRLIFIAIAYPTGRLEFGYIAPPDEETPLVLDIFNPTFWVMIEMLLGLWAANLPPLTPLLKDVDIPRKMSQVYRKLSMSGSVRTSEKAWPSNSNDSSAPQPVRIRSYDSAHGIHDGTSRDQISLQEYRLRESVIDSWSPFEDIPESWSIRQ